MVFPELAGAALVRELHVYGQLATAAGGDGSVIEHAHSDQQHVGLGTRLMRHAEIMAAAAGTTKVAVISGVGVRNYYRKLGYQLEPGEGEFMMKRLSLVFRLRHHRYSRMILAVLVLFVFPIALATARSRV